MKWIQALLWLLLATLTACQAQPSGATMLPMPPMKTWCLGRTTLQLPAGIRENYRASLVTLIFGKGTDFTTAEAQIIATGVDEATFHTAIDRRAKELATDINDVTHGPMLVADQKINPHTRLLRYFTANESNNYHTHELHLLVGDVHVRLKEKSYEGHIAPVEQHLMHMAAQIHPVVDPTQAGSGYCLGPVIIDTHHDYERGEFSFELPPPNRDISLEITFTTLNNSPDDHGLQARIAESIPIFGVHPRILRQGKTTLAGQPAEEWLGRHKEEGKIEHLFGIEAYPANPSPNNPMIQLQMNTGGDLPVWPVQDFPPYTGPERARWDQPPVTSSLSEHAALELWDAIVHSVSLRPGRIQP